MLAYAVTSFLPAVSHTGLVCTDTLRGPEFRPIELLDPSLVEPQIVRNLLLRNAEAVLTAKATALE